MPTLGWSQRGVIYHLVCIWLASGMWIPRMLWEGRVGSKVGLKWTSSATEPSPFGSMGPGARQVMTKTQMNYQVSLLYFALRCKVHPPLPHARQTGHQPPQQQQSCRACLGQCSGLCHGIIHCSTILLRWCSATLFLQCLH